MDFINSKQDLINCFQEGCKKEDQLSIGVEHEKFLFDGHSNQRVNFETITKVFNFLEKFGWKPIKEKNNVIALKREDQSITLEPGNQVELSGAKLKSIHLVCNESYKFLDELKEACKKINLKMMSVSFDPFTKLQSVPKTPKQRYEIMINEMPKKGEITFFDRSWYSRATVEITMGYCNKKQYTSFMRRVNNWEEDLLNEGIELRKIYLSVSKKEQQTRFKKRLKDPLRYWKLTDHDLSMAKKWDIYSFFKTQMLDRTSTQNHPWVVINANNKMLARLSSLRFVLNEFNYPDKNLEVADDWTSKITNYSYDFKGVTFENLSHQQFELLTKNLRE